MAGGCPSLGLACQGYLRCARRFAALTPASLRAGEQSSPGSQAARPVQSLMEEWRPLLPRCGTVGFAWTQPKEDADGPLYRTGRSFSNLHARCAWADREEAEAP